MKKGIFICIIAAAGSAIFSSCNNGNYDANPATNYSNIPVPVTTGGGGGSTSSFNWTGTDPISFKINGTAYQLTGGTIVTTSGIAFLIAPNGSDELSISFPDATAANATVSLGGSNTVAYGNPVNNNNTSALSGGSGGIKILENDATHIKGLFYATLVNQSTNAKETLTVGYFNVMR